MKLFKTPYTQRSGFTLVELVAALVIGSTLLVATLTVLRTATRYNKLARKDAQLQPALGLLTEQIERDFINARSIKIGINAVTIAGYMGESSPGSTLEPAIVEYQIQPARQSTQQSVLFRNETQPLADRKTRRQPLLSNITSFNVIVIAESDDETDVAGVSFGLPMQRMPTHLQIVIGDDTGPVLIKDILHDSGLN